MRLVAETMTPAAGQDVTLALDSRPEPGWHGYWQNPGDAGFPATLKWTLPKDVTVGEPAYPVPGMLLMAGLMNYVFEAPYAPLVTLKVPAGLAAGTSLPVKLHAQYLVCTKTLCVPEEADLSVDLTVGDGAVPAESRARFDAWRRAIPKPLDAKGSFQKEGTRIRIAVPYPASAPLADAYFFPVTTGLVDYAATQKVTRDGDRVVVETKAGTGGTSPLVGVLRIAPGQGLMVTAVAGTVAASSSSAGAPEGDADGDPDRLCRRHARRAHPKHHALRLPDPQSQGAQPRAGSSRRTFGAARGAGLYRRRRCGVRGAGRCDPRAAGGRQRGRLGIPARRIRARSWCCCC